MHETSREHGRRRRSRERGLAGERLEQHTAESEEITASIERLTRRLFRTHVRRCTDHHAHARECAGFLRCRQRLRDTEIGHDGVSLVQEDVLGLDVAMHHAMAMRVVEGVRDISADPRGRVDRQSTFLTETVAQRLATHYRHHEVQDAIGLAGIVQRQHVRMGQARRQSNLLRETVVLD